MASLNPFSQVNDSNFHSLEQWLDFKVRVLIPLVRSMIQIFL